LASKNQDRAAREARERLKAYQARQTVHEHATKRRFRDNLVAIIGCFHFIAQPHQRKPDGCAWPWLVLKNEYRSGIFWHHFRNSRQDSKTASIESVFLVIVG